MQRLPEGYPTVHAASSEFPRWQAGKAAKKWMAITPRKYRMDGSCSVAKQTDELDSYRDLSIAWRKPLGRLRRTIPTCCNLAVAPAIIPDGATWILATIEPRSLHPEMRSCFLIGSTDQIASHFESCFPSMTQSRAPFGLLGFRPHGR